MFYFLIYPVELNFKDRQFKTVEDRHTHASFNKQHNTVDMQLKYDLPL